MGIHRLRSRSTRRLFNASCEPLEDRLLLSKTIYVDAASPGPTRDGASWATSYADLQLALAAAVSGDTIRVADGTYKPTTTADRTKTFQLKSGVALYGGYAGYNAPNPDTRDIANNPTILSGEIGSAVYSGDNSYHVVTGSQTDANAILDGFTITAGNANGTSSPQGVPQYWGGGMVVNTGSPTLNNCVFLANSAMYGGGLSNTNCTSAITNCLFVGNSSTGEGGGISNESNSPVTVTNCSFTGNSGGDGTGGFLNYNSSPILSNCVFTRNTGRSGAGFSSYKGAPLVVDCVFSGNSAHDGGAVRINSSTAQLVNCAFTGNLGNAGGAAYANSGSFINCTVSRNSAVTGAAFCVFALGPTIQNCIIWDNTASTGGQIYVTSGAPTIAYSDVQGGWTGTGNISADPWFMQPPNSGADGLWGTPDDEGDLRPQPYSPVVDAGANASVPVDVTTDLAGGARFQDVPTTSDTGAGTSPLVDIGVYEAAPSLLANAGGPYFALVDQSLSLNGHGASNVPGSLQYAWDFDGDGQFNDAVGPAPTFPTGGTPRQLAVSLRITDGASQSAVASATITIMPRVLYVDARAAAGSTGASWNDAVPSLADALRHALPGQELRVAGGTYVPTDTLDREASFNLKSGVALFGSYAGMGAANPDIRDLDLHPSILSGDLGIRDDNSDNSFHVVTATGTDAATSLDGFTVSYGNADGAESGASGGAVFISGAFLRISNCRFINNAASNYGGAIYAGFSSNVGLSTCDFIANVADAGAAVTNATSSSILVVDCAFASNAASSSGAAVCNLASAELVRCNFTRNVSASAGGAVTNGSAMTMTSCTMSGNTAVSGGAAFSGGTSFVASNCTMVGNVASRGGGIYVSAGAASLVNCTVTANVAGSGGGFYSSSSTPLAVINCFMWNDTQDYGRNSITYSDYPVLKSGTGNISTNPLFSRTPSPGADGVWGTIDDDYGDLHISPASPLVDAGNNAAVPDGITTDLSGSPRFLDSPTTPDTGVGAAPVVDIGALEALPGLAADAGGPYALFQGQSLTLRGHGASDSPGQLGYAWEWTGDGLFDDASGPAPVFSALGMPPGDIVISLRVSDADARSVVASTTLSVHQATIYVDAGAPLGANDGTSWASAFRAVTDAIARAQPGQQIHVAGGTYKSSKQLSLKSGVVLAGGYAGLHAQDPDTRGYRTTLSDDFGPVGQSFGVVIASRVDASAVLDGFTITGSGLGLDIDNASPTITNCQFADNNGVDGGGIYIARSTSSAPTIANCLFVGNHADRGAGLYDAGSSARIINCTFGANFATNGGNSLYFSGSSAVTFVSGIVWGNNGNQVFIKGTPPSITYSDFQDPQPGAGNISADPQFILAPSPGPDTQWGTADDQYGDLRLQPTSPCIDAGSNASLPASVTTDFNGYARRIDVPSVPDTGLGTAPIVDMGIYEFPVSVTVPGTAGDDSFYVRLTPDQATIQIWTAAAPVGNPSFTYAADSLLALYLSTNDGNDSITLDVSNGLYRKLHVVAGNGIDSVTITGSTPSQRLEFRSLVLEIDSVSIFLTGIESLQLASLNDTPINLASLTIATPLSIAAPAGVPLRTGSLQITAAGSLDLAGHSLIVDYAASSPLQSIRQYLQNARLGLTPSLLTSDAALPALGFVDNTLLHLPSFAATPLAAPFSQVLIRPTLPGDTNLDGQVNQADYLNVLANMGSTNSHWFLGDLNDDAQVTPDDLAEITAHLSPLASTPPMPLFASPLSASAAVPAAPLSITNSPASAAQPALRPSRISRPAHPTPSTPPANAPSLTTPPSPSPLANASLASARPDEPATDRATARLLQSPSTNPSLDSTRDPTQ